MAFRNPRFSYYHHLREFGDSAFTASTSAFDAATPRSRWFDDQAKLLAGVASGATGFSAYIQRTNSASGAVEHPNDLNRLIIPGGSIDFGNKAEIALTGDPVGDEVTFRDIDLVDGFNRARVVPSSGVLALEFATPAADPDLNGLARLIRAAFSATDGGASNPVRIGELWWTQTVEPASGVLVEWEDFIVPTQERLRTRSGASFVNRTGQDLRSFRIGHRVDEGADRQIYEDLLRWTRNGAHPFWFEPPVDPDIVDWSWHTGNNLTGVSASGNASVTNASTVLPGTTGITQFIRVATSGAGSGAVRVQPEDGSTTKDLRGHVLQFDTRLPTTWWLTAPTHIVLNIVSSTNGQVDENLTTKFQPWRGLDQAQEVDGWKRVFVDLDDDVTGIGAEGSAGLEEANRLIFNFTFQNASDLLWLSNFRAVRKDSLPVLVEIVDYRRRQVGRNPSAKASWLYEFDLLEVSS